MSPAELKERAARYRQMALQVSDPRTVEALQALAKEYEARAALGNDGAAGRKSLQPER